MKPLRTLAIGCVVVLGLQGCATPQIASANERGGIVKFANGTNEDAAFKLADAYCHQHGRVAQITGTDAIYNRIMFACVEP